MVYEYLQWTVKEELQKNVYDVILMTLFISLDYLRYARLWSIFEVYCSVLWDYILVSLPWGHIGVCIVAHYWCTYRWLDAFGRNEHSEEKRKKQEYCHMRVWNWLLQNVRKYDTQSMNPLPNHGRSYLDGCMGRPPVAGDSRGINQWNWLLSDNFPEVWQWRKSPEEGNCCGHFQPIMT